jgi:CheY-like chemotaxis protein
VRRALEDCDTEVVVAASSEEGVERLRSARSDVIATDIGMPGMDGHSSEEAERFPSRQLAEEVIRDILQIRSVSDYSHAVVKVP